MRQIEQLLRDTFLFLAGLGGQTAAVVAEASSLEPASTCFVHVGPGSRIDAVLANRIAKQSL